MITVTNRSPVPILACEVTQDEVTSHVVEPAHQVRLNVPATGFVFAFSPQFPAWVGTQGTSGFRTLVYPVARGSLPYWEQTPTADTIREGQAGSVAPGIFVLGVSNANPTSKEFPVFAMFPQPSSTVPGTSFAASSHKIFDEFCSDWRTFVSFLSDIPAVTSSGGFQGMSNELRDLRMAPNIDRQPLSGGVVVGPDYSEAQGLRVDDVVCYLQYDMARQSGEDESARQEYLDQLHTPSEAPQPSTGGAGFGTSAFAHLATTQAAPGQVPQQATYFPSATEADIPAPSVPLPPPDYSYTPPAEEEEGGGKGLLLAAAAGLGALFLMGG